MSKKRNVKLADIAKLAKVDVSTVSLCLNNSPKVAEKTRKRIVELAESMNYFPNIHARTLRSGKSNMIAMLIPDLDLQFFIDMLVAMEHYIYNADYSSILTVVRDHEKEVFQRLIQRNIDGVCLGYPRHYSDETYQMYQDFISYGKPLAFYIEKSHLSLFDSLGANMAICDISLGARSILQYLYDNNHRKICITTYIPERLADYQQFYNEKGIEIDERMIISSLDDFDNLGEKILSLMKLDDPPTAVYAQSDSLAIEVSKILLNNGYKIPDDVSVIGINNISNSDFLKVPLTTLSIPSDKIGESLAKMVVDQLENPDLKPQRKYFNTKLEIRGSVRSI